MFHTLAMFCSRTSLTRHICRRAASGYGSLRVITIASLPRSGRSTVPDYPWSCPAIIL